MKRYDLRHLKDDFYGKLESIIDTMREGEVNIFLFEVGDFSSVEKSAKLVKSLECELMNSLKFNEVDWSIVVKKSKKFALDNEQAKGE
jgi:NADH-quinone oxidoreductase subunit E